MQCKQSCIQAEFASPLRGDMSGRTEIILPFQFLTYQCVGMRHQRSVVSGL